MHLHPEMTAPEIADLLTRALTGQTVSEIAPVLERMGARNLVLTDAAQSGLAAGTVLAEGLRAGDPVVVAVFGIGRGWLRPDRRVQARMTYDAAGVVTDLSGVALIAK